MYAYYDLSCLPDMNIVVCTLISCGFLSDSTQLERAECLVLYPDTLTPGVFRRIGYVATYGTTHQQCIQRFVLEGQRRNFTILWYREGNGGLIQAFSSILSHSQSVEASPPVLFKPFQQPRANAGIFPLKEALFQESNKRNIGYLTSYLENSSAGPFVRDFGFLSRITWHNSLYILVPYYRTD